MDSSGLAPTLVLERSAVHEDTVSALVLRCDGEVDALNAPHLRSAVVDGLVEIDTTPTHAADDRRLLVVDLRAVTFFGASAVTALLRGAAEAPAGVAVLRLVVGDTRPVRLVVDALDLHTTFSIHHDLPDALHHRGV